MQRWIARLLAIGQREHLGTQARPAHPQKKRMFEPCGLHVLAQRSQRRKVRLLALHDIQPAEPLALVVIGPEAGILRPEARRLVVSLPVRLCCLQTTH